MFYIFTEVSTSCCAVFYYLVCWPCTLECCLLHGMSMCLCRTVGLNVLQDSLQCPLIALWYCCLVAFQFHLCTTGQHHPPLILHMTGQAVPVPQHSWKGPPLGYRQMLPVVLQKQCTKEVSWCLDVASFMLMLALAVRSVFTASTCWPQALLAREQVRHHDDQWVLIHSWSKVNILMKAVHC